ncbi:MAG: 2-succinyl-6-hydroxy-2,4-cyclohexadiene-1-carboxylate synthase [Balneolaceae bacterium]|nr:2-succinyl-6-hydroxy-2,4-cyclohexadiene-1-carboxylate synthase [Balneolaceae bacterium]
MNIRIRGISYYFKVHQEDPNLPYIVFLHGFMGSSTNFEHLIPPLKQFCNPVTIDLLGHGKSEGAELHYRFSAREQIADLTKLISEQLHIPLYLYGYSMGGRLALHLMLHRPDLYRGLILESSTFGIENESERQARQSLDARRSDHIIGNFPGFLKEWKSKPLFKSRHTSRELLMKLSGIQEKQKALWMANTLLGFGTGTMPSVKEKLNEITIPVQLIAGKEDAKFVQIAQLMTKQIPNSDLSLIEHAGHRVHLDQAERVTETLQTFLTNT